MAGADAGNIKIKGAWMPPLALISDYMFDGPQVVTVRIVFHLSDDSNIIYYYNE